MSTTDAELRAAVVEARAEVARLSPGENATQADRDAWALALANRIVVEEKFIDAALASSPAPAGLDDPEAPCPDCVHPNDWHGTEHGCVKGDCDRRYPAPAGLDVAIAEVVAREAADAAFPDSAVAREHFLVGYRAATRPAEDAS